MSGREEFHAAIKAFHHALPDEEHDATFALKTEQLEARADKLAEAYRSRTHGDADPATIERYAAFFSAFAEDGAGFIKNAAKERCVTYVSQSVLGLAALTQPRTRIETSDGPMRASPEQIAKLMQNAMDSDSLTKLKRDVHYVTTLWTAHEWSTRYAAGRSLSELIELETGMERAGSVPN